MGERPADASVLPPGELLKVHWQPASFGASYSQGRGGGDLARRKGDSLLKEVVFTGNPGAFGHTEAGDLLGSGGRVCAVDLWGLVSRWGTGQGEEEGEKGGG